MKLNAANNNQLYWFNQSTLVRGGVSLDNFDGGNVTALQDGTGLVEVGGGYHWFTQATLIHGGVGLDNLAGVTSEVTVLGDGTAMMKLNPANSEQLYWFDQTTIQRGTVGLGGWDGSTVTSLQDGKAVLQITRQDYMWDQTAVARNGFSTDFD